MIRTNDSKSKATVKAAVVLSAFLLFAAVMGFGQQQINLTAGPAGITTPDGSSTPMWGYTCGAAVTGSSATCAPLSGPSSGAAQGALGAVTVINGGSGYTSAPTVTISAPTGITGVTSVQAAATAVVNGGQVVAINLTTFGAGYTSAPAVTLAGGGGSGAAATAGLAWSPVVITVPTGATGGLQINLTNNLLFMPAGGTTANSIPTSLTIIGQVGGGLGQGGVYAPSPDHSASQGNVTWFIANTGAQGVPPKQGQRVQSFATEVEAVAPSTTAPTCAAGVNSVAGCAMLTWPVLKPGTYLLESGTHPSIQVPMGLIGMLVVTCNPNAAASSCGADIANGTAYPAAPAGTSSTQAIPAVQYNAEVPLEFSEIDPVQNLAVTKAVNTVGFSETATYGPQFSGSVSYITVTNGGSGYTSVPKVSVTAPTGTGTLATATATAYLSNGSVTSIVVNTQGSGYTSAPAVTIDAPASSGTQATASAQLALGANELGHCGEGVSVINGTAAAACYPPAVNYTPFYFLINGTPFSKGNAVASLFPAGNAGLPVVPNSASTMGISGNILVRMVNAGLKMHVPSIVGSQTTGFSGSGTPATVGGFTLIAEDGNTVPDLAAPRVQTHVFMPAGKTYDVMINAPVAPTTSTPAPGTLPVYDRELSLSANSSERDAGMLAYISVNGGLLPTSLQSGGALANVVANPDNYPSVAACAASPCIPFAVSDVSKGVIANDVNVYGVQIASATQTCGMSACPVAAGTVLLNANGTFTYTPKPGFNSTSSDSFGYCANGSTTICTTVTLGASTLTGSPVANNVTFTANTSTFVRIPPPGVLSVDTDPNNLPLSVVTTGANAPSNLSSGLTLYMDAKGGFTANVPGAGTYTFTYTAQNSQGVTATAQVTLIFPQPSNLQVKVVDGQAYANCNGDSTCIAGLPQVANGDYRWIIEEDKTFYVDPNCTTNTSVTTPGCPGAVAGGSTGSGAGSTIPLLATNFHTSAMQYVAQGCTGPLSCESGQTVFNPATGTHVPAACDMGNGVCDTTRSQWVESLPSSVHLDPTKRYYISVLPGDAANPFATFNVTGPGATAGNGCTPTSTTSCPSTGHTMSGAPIPAACNLLLAGCTSTSTAAFAPVIVKSLPTPLPTGKLSVIVFEDDFPLNGEQDAGGGIDVLSPGEPGLGEFNLVLWDTFGSLGDVTGQDTYDAFNQPLSNALAGTMDPVTGLDACPISAQDTSQPGITGMIVTCPKYESDNATLSPLAGQALIANLMPDKFSVQAYPGADRIARGEEWLQTNTLDGQHPHDAFIRIGEPGYFQEYGPAGYHVAIGFANPAIINARHDAVCAGAYGAVGACNNTITGQVVAQRMSRIPDERLYPSGSPDRRELSWTQCWVSLGDPDAEDFMFTKCDANGHFTFTGVPGGNWRLTLGDQWNDQIIDGLSTPANVSGGQTLNMGQVGVQQWQANVYTKTYIDDNKNGIPDTGEIGIPLIYTMVHYRDGSRANVLATDFNGVANFNETFPLFNWYVVESDSTRYKTTGIHTVYDAGGPADGSSYCGNTTNGNAPCGNSTGYLFMANTYERNPLPPDLSVPGAVYCVLADCTAEANADFVNGIAVPSTGVAGLSTGRIDPPWVESEGASLLLNQGAWIEFGKAPYAACPPACATVPVLGAPTAAGTPVTTQVGENGGIHGQVSYASTRPFDDASQMILQPWEPLVPHVTINLYQEGFAADNVTPTLKLVDTTQSSSWDDWAQGFYANSSAGSGPAAGQKPYMSCPGQGTATSTTNPDVFFYTLYDQPEYLDLYNSQHNGGTLHTLPYNSQFKCYDADKIFVQTQPAPYDGEYYFPSSLGIDLTTGKPLPVYGGVGGNGPGTTGFQASSMLGTNCTICVPNPTTATKPTSGDLSGYDPYRAGTPMLPPGKYVVEVVPPPGYEIYKEEDKNLLIGDNFIAPVTQQFAGLGGYIFIMPDQASVASLYDESGAGYNPNNAQNATTGLGLADELSGVPGYPGFQDPLWPCVGEQRIVPDYLSLFPQAQEVAPFAGATRPLCDRKEVTLGNEMSVRMHFAIFTSTHIAAHFTGVITDDFTSEFDPFAPMFGEKFSPPNQPVSTRDYLGNEISRVYSDHFGIYDGLMYSSWEVNPPNITGYSPIMAVQCMNDPGPIPDGKGGWMTDPLFNPAYSDFCYEDPFMPGLTDYLDTPVVPTEAFVGAGYNNVDCAYPDTTPAIAEVDSPDGVGPWVKAAGETLTITALGDQSVNNYAYGGPSASAAPFNAKTITRHYGFGTQCMSLSTNCTAVSSVTIGGVNAIVNNWNDTSITVTVPGRTSTCTTASSTCNPRPVPLCAIQQQAQYGGPGRSEANAARCGQLVITAGNGRQSIDAVTVTIGGKAPTHVGPSGSVQSAIDAAAPGDMIIVDPTCSNAGSPTACAAPSATNVHTSASHIEFLIMWKPVRLQGVGAASSIINANAQPAGKLLDPWRRHMNCLFGLTIQGVPYGNSTPFDPSGTYSCPETGWQYFSGHGQTVNGSGAVTTNSSPQVDRLPLEAVVGWDASLNGNLAEMLQEPSLMGAYEGAGVTVLGKGVEFHGQNPWNDGTENGAFPLTTTLLTGVVRNPASTNEGAGGTGLSVGDFNSYCHTVTYNSNGTVRITSQTNPYPSNFICNPSSIDGLTITNSSQGGGGIFAHGWAHYLEIANNRIYNNAGTLTGGISVGQGEFAPATIKGGTVTTAPGTCSDGTGFVTNQHEPRCLQMHTNIHNNSITGNSSTGDELFSATLAGSGGATFCTGNDYYKFNYNWVCGNLSTAEGGGLVHLGEIFNGDIEHNSFVFNQSSNPTIPTNGGAIMVQGTPDTDPVCPGVPDTDCPPGLSDGTGPGLVINANLIQGNSADSGSGGGIRLQQVNGTEVNTFAKQSQRWNDVTITNNLIVNNMAGWDGAGISLQDALKVNIINNTIAHNDALADSGVLATSIGAPQSSAPAGNCVQNGPTGPTTASCPQSAGVTSTPNSGLLTSSFGGLTLSCPDGHSNCQGFSNPILVGNVIWQNRSFFIGVGNLGGGYVGQQNLVSLFDAGSGSPAPTQTTTGVCGTGDSYWDIGVRGDQWLTGQAAPNHLSTFTLNPMHSVLTNTSGYDPSNSSADPTVVAEYCNGSRVPPECSAADGCGGPNGFGVPPGIVDSITPNPVFTLTPAATVDEGNNWINVGWGPLSLSNPSVTGGPYNNYGGGAPLGNYVLQSSSPAVGYIACLNQNANTAGCIVTLGTAGSLRLPTTDYFNNPRPDPNTPNTSGGCVGPGSCPHVDVGAVELQIAK